MKAQPATMPPSGSESAVGSAPAPASILVVDDDPVVRECYKRVIERLGHRVLCAADGEVALKRLREHHVDAVLSDVRMPNIDGAGLLEAIRKTAPDLPVLLATAEASVESAIHAVEYGAVAYLRKPVSNEQLRSSVAKALSLGKMAHLKRMMTSHFGDDSELERRRAQELARDMDRGLEGLFIAYQPVVHASNGELYGYEALMRTTHDPLRSPLAFLETAERLHRMYDLGRAIRRIVAEPLDTRTDIQLLINISADDLLDETLYSTDTKMATHASRIVLEITERASLDRVADVSARIARLRGIGYRIAVDDLGAGYAGLSAIAILEPDIMKLDMSLIRGIDANATKRSLVQSMLPLARDLGALVIAEGVETEAEKAVLCELGCNLLQGYLLGRPEPLPRA